jgi:5'-3' exonuclease
MGILNLNSFLKEKVPEAFFKLPLDALRGRRIAIDAANWMYANMHVLKSKIIDEIDLVLMAEEMEHPVIDPLVIRKRFVETVIRFVQRMLGKGVTPVFVFEGTHPEEKSETKSKRAEKVTAAGDMLKELWAKFRAQSILDRSPALILEIKKLLKAELFVSVADILALRRVLSILRIPSLQATGDAEKLCSMLCIEGKVGAVFSADSDNLAYGCPLLLTRYSVDSSYERGRNLYTLDCVRIDRVLDGPVATHLRYVRE